MSHDRSALQIDMLLSNTGLLAVKKKNKKKKRGTDGWRPGWESTKTRMKDGGGGGVDRGKDEKAQKGGRRCCSAEKYKVVTVESCRHEGDADMFWFFFPYSFKFY